jgi:hypothetical protein
MVLALLVLLRLPRPFRKLPGELAVLLDLSSDSLSFPDALPMLTATVLRRYSPPALSGGSHLPPVHGIGSLL